MEEIKNEQYKNALELMKFEAQMLWQIMQTYLLVNTILFAIISNSIFKVGEEHNTCGIIILSILGIVITFVWLGTYYRNSAYYMLRLYQAKEYENEDFPLLNGNGEKFALGFEVEVKNKKISMNVLAYILNNKRGVLVIIFGFIVLFILLIANEFNNLL